MANFMTWLLLLVNIVGCAFAAYAQNFSLMMSDIVVVMLCIQIIDLRARFDEIKTKEA